MFWIFCHSERRNLFLAVQWHLCQDAPVHPSISATTADVSVAVCWCGPGCWGLNYIFIPLCREHTAHCKIHHCITNVVWYMLSHLLVQAFDMIINNTHKTFISSFKHLPWFASWSFCSSSSRGGMFVKQSPIRANLKCLACRRNTYYWFTV